MELYADVQAPVQGSSHAEVSTGLSPMARHAAMFAMGAFDDEGSLLLAGEDGISPLREKRGETMSVSPLTGSGRYRQTFHDRKDGGRNSLPGCGGGERMTSSVGNCRMMKTATGSQRCVNTAHSCMCVCVCQQLLAAGASETRHVFVGLAGLCAVSEGGRI